MDVPLYFYLAFKDMERLAAGSDTSTYNVLDLLNIDSCLKLNILDIGCGVGSDTLILADYFKNSTVEAVDLFGHYLDALNSEVSKNNLNDRILTYEMDMNDLDFANEEFDIVFSHASAEIIGFRKALRKWKRLIKKDGYLICSDLTWILKPSAESKEFWLRTYAEVDTIENKISQIENAGFKYINHYTIPKSDFDGYYSKLKSNLAKLKSDKSAKDFIKQLEDEISISKNDDFSYVFYIMKKSNHQ